MAYMQLGFISLSAPTDAFEKARAAAEKTLEIDDTIVDAQLVVAMASQILDYDQARARQAYERAVEVSPEFCRRSRLLRHYVSLANGPT